MCDSLLQCLHLADFDSLRDSRRTGDESD